MVRRRSSTKKIFLRIHCTAVVSMGQCGQLRSVAKKEYDTTMGINTIDSEYMERLRSPRPRRELEEAAERLCGVRLEAAQYSWHLK
jgi:hypothetical protein